MIWLAMAVAAFLATHTLPALPGLRRRLIACLGRPLYFSLYSMVSLGMLGLVVAAYRHAPYVPLPWAWWPGAVWVPIAVMPFACCLLVGGLVTPNPFSLSVWSMERALQRWNPMSPGVLRVVRHPILWALGLWAIAHGVANGDVASAIVFGLFALLSLGGMVSLDAKAKRCMGLQKWMALARNTSGVPFSAFCTGGRCGLGRRGLAISIAGLVLYGVLLGLHPWVIGVAVVPL